MPAPSAEPISPAPRPEPRRSRRLAGLPPTTPVTAQLANMISPLQAYYSYIVDCISDINPFAGAAKKNKDPDTYTWDEAMASPYREQFLKAADEEIDALLDNDTWSEDQKRNAINRIVPSQWVFRIKRSPDGEIRKFKARCVLRGDLQDYTGETFAPVASWATVRTFFITCLVLGWITISIDFSNAFVQSILSKSEQVWMHVPRGYYCTQGPDYCLKLKKSLYGHKVAPLLWYHHLTKAFEELGLEKSKYDPCLWYGKDIILVQYVDDCGIGAPSQEIIDKFVKGLRSKGLALTQEGSFSEFLGIKFDKKPDGTFELTQKGLIQKILKAANMTDCNPNSLPAAMTPLETDEDGEPMQESWNYRAIAGMLLYLSTNTRPDISFAVSQICRFSHAPKKSHATAIKTLLRYLKKTADQGMIINPSKWFELDLYVDADFCGLFGKENPRNRDSARSRSGYIILLCGCPVLWKSQLQTALAQSTLESEYYALSYALKTFLPLKRLLHEMIEKTKCKALEGATVHGTVFEDNAGAYYLATNHKITNRTKYFLAKFHWFWQAYDDKEFDIVKCPTDKQRADYLTKALPKVAFENNRGATQGW